MARRATPVNVYKSVGTVASVVDRKVRDVAVQAAVPLLVSSSSVHTDGQVVAVATARPSYTSVATQTTLVPTGPRNWTSGGPVPPAGVVGPQPVGTRALVEHGDDRFELQDINLHCGPNNPTTTWEKAISLKGRTTIYTDGSR